MSVNLEVKGMLARLLATEDIVVEHKKVETACFNVHTRVLTLPMWEKASNNIYDLLVAHECGHSIHTPDEDWTENVKVPPQFVNIVEDARIEKLMKRRYAGLAKTFFNGYKELAAEDFFQIKDDNIETYNLADRANLYFKIGNFINMEFNQEEKDIINLIAASETFPEVLEAAEALYKYCKQKKEEEKTDLDIPSQTSGNSNEGASDFSDQQQGDNDQPEMEGDEGAGAENNSTQPKQQTPSAQGGEEDEDPEVKTVDKLEEAIRDLVNNSGYENTYLEVPTLDLNRIIASNDEIHQRCADEWANYILRERNFTEEILFGEVDKEFQDFKRSAQKEVNYLVKEFECRKAADSYARSSTARTGVLDCSKLHTYKYNEDLFKKVTTLANGKNHGLVFILDWSGSMSHVVLDTIKQLFNLVWFCKKVSIPFEVYAFTTDYPLVTYDKDGKANLRTLAYQKREGLLHVGEWFSLMNMLTSKTNGKTLDNQMKNIYRIAKSMSRWTPAVYPIPSGLSLSGTPLNETLIALHSILPQFQREHKLQKVQCVVLTDGEASPLKCHKEINRRWEEEPYIGAVNINPHSSFLRDRKTGNTYSLDCEWYGFTDILLRNLRDRFPSVNFIGMRVLESRDANTFIRRYCGYYGDEFDRVSSYWRKEKTFSLKNSGYHTYFGLSATALGNDAEFDVAEDASKTQIRSAFAKSLKSKKLNKKVLGEFMELVA